jgi:hypothetical protein
MYIQSLRCLKLKYLSFFSAQWVSRHLGMDVNLGVLSCYGLHEVLVPSRFTDEQRAPMMVNAISFEASPTEQFDIE